MNKNFNIVFLLFHFLIISVAAIDVDRFIHLNNSDGFSGKDVNAIIQDRYGYMWFASNEGVSCYDGKTFVNYLVDTTNPHAIPCITNRELYLDLQGNLWVGSGNFIGIFIPAENHFNFFSVDTLGRKSTRMVLDIINLDSETFLVSTTIGLFLFDKETKLFTGIFHRENDPASLPSNTVNDVFRDSRGNLWVATWEGGIAKMIVDGNKNVTFQPIRLKEQNSTFDSRFVMNFQEDSKGMIWISDYGNGIACFDPANYTIVKKLSTQDGLTTNYIKYVLIDMNENVWAGTDGEKLNFIDLNKNVVSIIMPNYKDSKGYRGYSSLSAFQSSDGVLWFGNRVGINYYFKLPIETELYKLDMLNPFQNSYSHVLSIFPLDEKKILLGYASDPVTEFDIETKKHTTRWLLKNAIGFMRDKVDGSIYVIGASYLVKVYPDNFEFKEKIPFEPPNSKLFINNYCVIRDTLYLLSNHGILHYSHGMKNIQLFAGLPDILFENYNKDIPVNFLADEDNVFWLISANHLIRYNPRSKEATKWNLNNDGENKKLYAIKLIKNNIYIGSENGFFIFNKNSLSFRFVPIISQNKDVISNVFVEDMQGFIWIGMPNAVIRYDTLSGKISQFDSRDVFNNALYSINSAYLLNDTCLLMGGIMGLNVFNPEHYKRGNNHLRLMLRSVENEKRIFNTTFDTSLFYSYTFGYKENNLKLNFSLLNYVKPENNSYFYKVKGKDSDWQYMVGNSLILSYLSHGTYIFKVIGENALGEISDEMQIEITIKPPFWKTTQFFVLLALSIFFIIMLIYRINTRNIRNKNKILNRLVSERTLEIQEKNEELITQKEEILTQNELLESQKGELEKLNQTKDKLFSIISHDLKNPFNVIGGFAKLIISNYYEYDDEQKLELLHIIKNSADDAFRLFENLLAWSRSSLNNLKFNPTACNLNQIIKESIAVVKPHAQKKKIEINYFEYDRIVLADTEMLKLIIRNLLTNAVKFTPSSGSVSVIVEDNDGITIAVADTGLGMSEEKTQNLFRDEIKNSTYGTEGETGTGIGLTLCHEFVKRHGGIITVSSVLNEGTTFAFTLPTSDIHQ